MIYAEREGKEGFNVRIVAPGKTFRLAFGRRPSDESLQAIVDACVGAYKKGQHNGEVRKALKVLAAEGKEVVSQSVFNAFQVLVLGSIQLSGYKSIK